MKQCQKCKKKSLFSYGGVSSEDGDENCKPCYGCNSCGARFHDKYDSKHEVIGMEFIGYNNWFIGRHPRRCDDCHAEFEVIGLEEEPKLKVSLLRRGEK